MTLHNYFNERLVTFMPSELQDEFDFYRANQADLLKRFEGKVVVIKDGQIIGVFEDEATAIQIVQKDHKLGTFLVQRVTPGDSAYSQSFHSRVAFG